MIVNKQIRKISSRGVGKGADSAIQADERAEANNRVVQYVSRS